MFGNVHGNQIGLYTQFCHKIEREKPNPYEQLIIFFFPGTGLCVAECGNSRLDFAGAGIPRPWKRMGEQRWTFLDGNAFFHSSACFISGHCCGLGRKSVRLPRELMERVIYYDMHWSLGPIPRRRGILCLCSRKTWCSTIPPLWIIWSVRCSS